MIVEMIMAGLFLSLAFVWLVLFKDTNSQATQDLILLQFSRGEVRTHAQITERLRRYEISLGPDTVWGYMEVSEQEGYLKSESDHNGQKVKFSLP